MSADGAKIRFGIIGTGLVANNDHGPALRQADNCLLWSVLSRDPTRARQFADRHGAAAPQSAHTSLADMLRDRLLQAVIVASPDKLHVGHILACARAGKHVLVEKPLVTSLEDGALAIETCRQQGVKLGVGFHSRWHSGHRKLRQRIHQDAVLGSLRHVRVHWSYKAEEALHWRTNDDLSAWWALGGLGAHCLDLIHWFVDTPDRSVTARSGLLQRQPTAGHRDRTAMMQFSYSDGVTAECTTSSLYDAPRRIEIYGTKGAAFCDGTLGRRGAGRILINDEPLEFEVQSPFENQLRDFASAIRDDRAPDASAEAGLQVVDDIVNIAGR